MGQVWGSCVEDKKMLNWLPVPRYVSLKIWLYLALRLAGYLANVGTVGTGTGIFLFLGLRQKLTSWLKSCAPLVGRFSGISTLNRFLTLFLAMCHKKILCSVTHHSKVSKWTVTSNILTKLFWNVFLRTRRLCSVVVHALDRVQLLSGNQ
jgi:hypothetical protein